MSKILTALVLLSSLQTSLIQNVQAVVSSDQNNWARMMSEATLENIPIVGSFLGKLLGFYWPADDSVTEAKMMQAIKAEVGEAVMSNSISRIVHIHRKFLNNYGWYEDLANEFRGDKNSKARRLERLAELCTGMVELFKSMTEPQRRHLLPYVTMSGRMCMSFFREYAGLIPSLYRDRDGKPPTEKRRQMLVMCQMTENAYDFVQTANKMWCEWKQWRLSMITITRDNSVPGLCDYKRWFVYHINDAVTGEVSTVDECGKTREENGDRARAIAIDVWNDWMDEKREMFSPLEWSKVEADLYRDLPWYNPDDRSQCKYSLDRNKAGATPRFENIGAQLNTEVQQSHCEIPRDISIINDREDEKSWWG